jgi:predicted transcriptional regulator
MKTLDLFRHDFVLSIRPEYATKIISGEKTVELRRKFPNGTVTGAIVYVYATVPIQAVIGWAKIADVKRLKVHDIWEQFKDVACIQENDFLEYFGDLKSGFVLMLEAPQPLSNPVALSELKARLNFVPPQSYCYADDSFRRLIQDG